MKTKLGVLILVFSLLNLQNVFGLEIKRVDNTQTPNGGYSSNQFIELLNNSDSIVNISGYKILDKKAPSNGHSISTSSLALDFEIEPNSYFIIAIDPSKDIFKNTNCKVFRSPIGIGIEDNISIKKESSIINTFHVSQITTLASTFCDSNSNNETSTSTGTSTESTSTPPVKEDTKTVYVYVPVNNQQKYGDIQVLLPEERIVPALADVEYTVKAIDSQKRTIANLDFNWSFGDGGEKFAKTVSYRYVYPGDYTLIATADGFTSSAQARMNVKVVKPDLSISKVGVSKEENYIDLENKTNYDLSLSNFYLEIDNKPYQLPKNFTIAKNRTVHVSGEALGFSLPAFSVSLLYPNKNLLTRYIEIIDLSSTTADLVESVSSTPNIIPKVENILINSLPNIDKNILKINNSQIKTYKTAKTFLINSKETTKNRDLESGKTESVLRRLVWDLDLKKVEKYRENEKFVPPVSQNKQQKPQKLDTGIINWLKNLIY